MTLNQPKNITWIVAVALGGLGIAANYLPILAGFLPYAFWLVVAGFAILAIATLVKGL